MIKNHPSDFQHEAELSYPAFFPYCFEGGASRLVKPYLPRISRGIIADWSVSREFFEDQRVFYGLNSPALLSLEPNSRVKDCKSYGAIEMKRPRCRSERIKPLDVIARQEELADFAFTLDLPITARMDERERKRRFRLTIANAAWMLENKRRRNLILFAVIQGWDPASYRTAAREIAGLNFGGVAIGGLRQFGTGRRLIREIVEAVKTELPGVPLHLFGTDPDLACSLMSENLIGSGTATIKKLIKTRKELSSADVPHIICRIADANRIALPLSAYRLTRKRQKDVD